MDTSVFHRLKIMKTLKFPYSKKLIKSLLKEFGWDFEGLLKTGGYHPVRTGNCQHSNMDNLPHATGNLERGVYQNAAASCHHCYPGSNQAMLIWHKGMGEITLFANKYSTKPDRAVESDEHLSEEVAGCKKQ